MKFSILKECIMCIGASGNYDEFVHGEQSDLCALVRGFDRQRPIYLFLQNCHPLESYFLGFLLKLKNHDGFDIRIVSNDMKVVKTLEALGLQKLFKVTFRDIT